MKRKNFLKGGSWGGVKITVTVVLVVLVSGIIVASKLGPIYSAKWELEDYMESCLLRFAALGEEGMFGDLQMYVENRQLPIAPWDNCSFTGDLGKPGRFSCSYNVKINFYNIYTYNMKVIALAKVTQIPATSF